MVTIKETGAQLSQMKRQLAGIKNGTDKAIGRAAKRVASQTRSYIAKETKSGLLIKQSVLKKFITHQRYKYGAAVVLKEGNRLPLSLFGAFHDEVGVSYQIKKGGTRRYIDDAFMGPKPGVVSPRLGGNVFKRVGKSRLPIRKMMGPSVKSLFVRRQLYKQTKEFIETKFSERLQHEINFLLSKAKKTTG